MISFSSFQRVYPFLDFFFRSVAVAALPESIDLTGLLSTGDRTEDTLPSALLLENGFDFVWFGLRLLTPLRPIFCSLIAQSSHYGVDLDIFSGGSDRGIDFAAAI
jgi:hypothetical protein